MTPLILKEVFDPRYPDFPIRRLLATVHFETVDVAAPAAFTLFEGALIDSAAPYVVIPHEFHSPRQMTVYQELGLRPYRLLSGSGELEMQRFTEVGMRFLFKQPGGSFGFWPERFVRVKAYLLDADSRPKKKILIGLDALLENFIAHLEKDNSSLRSRGAGD